MICMGPLAGLGGQKWVFHAQTAAVPGISCTGKAGLFFFKKKRVSTGLPAGLAVVENKITGLPIVKKKLGWFFAL